jgi:hypothetical protein
MSQIRTVRIPNRTPEIHQLWESRQCFRQQAAVAIRHCRGTFGHAFNVGGSTERRVVVEYIQKTYVTYITEPGTFDSDTVDGSNVPCFESKVALAILECTVCR